MDSFGRLFTIADWGDTHGPFMEGSIRGVPAGTAIDMELIRAELARRAPSASPTSTQRREPDKVTFLSGIENGLATGEEIRYRIPNRDVKIASDSNHILKPSHASYTYNIKYGARSNEECGRASARQTVCRVVAGAVAKCVLRPYGITFHSEVVSTGQPACEGDTVGALVRCTISHVPAGLGEPVYDKFDARLAAAMLSINAAKGFELGEGFAAAHQCGSQYNDTQNADFSFNSNHDGGVQAGITNGQDIIFTVAFKPIPTLQIPQQTVTFDGEPATYTGNNRNDLCVAPRVLPIVEAMAAIVTLDFLLIDQQQDTIQQLIQQNLVYEKNHAYPLVPHHMRHIDGSN
jgi:chorismate synthase